MPTVLIILLKRYKRENDVSSRINSEFDMNNSSKLDLTINSQNIDCDLYATGNHTGTTGGGHYYSWIKNGNQWNSFNDSAYGDSVTFNNANQKGPYVLFYKTKSANNLQINYNDIFIKSVNSYKKSVSDNFINDVYLKMTFFDKDSFGRTPLFYAGQSSVRDNSALILKLITDKTCNMNEHDNANQETPLQIAMKNATDDSFMNIVTMLNHNTFTESMINPASSSHVKSLTDLFTKLDNGIQTKIQNAIAKKEIKQKFMPTTATATATSTASTATTASTLPITTAKTLPITTAKTLPITTATPIQCPIIIKFSNSQKDVKIIDMDVDSTKCNNNTLERLPFDATKIVDGTQYLTFVTFEPDNLFVTGVDFTIQSSAKCNQNLQKILNDSISSSSSSSGSSSAVPVIVGITGGGGASTPTASVTGGVIVATTTPTPATTNFNPKNGDWIKFYQNYYKVNSFAKKDNKYTIKYEYNSYGNKKYKYSSMQTTEITCKPGKCSVITDPDKIKELEDLSFETK